MRVLLLEDEEALSELIAARLAGEGHAVDRFTTMADADAALRAVDYDLLVLDLGLPDGDGLTLLRDLRARGQRLPVLVLTARDAVEDRVAGLDAGADDYLTKPFHADELKARIRALLRRPAREGGGLRLGNAVLEADGRSLRVGGKPLPLRRREQALLAYLMRHAGKVVLKEDIETSLYAFGDEVASNAVEVHIYRLRRKLQAAGADMRIHTVRGVGYMIGIDETGMADGKG